MGRTLLLGAVVAVGLIAAVIALSARGDGDAPGPVGAQDLVGATAAPFGLSDAATELPDAALEGWAGADAVEIADLLGGAPLVLNFWATWCAPCVAEMPDLQRLHEAAGEELRLVGVNVQDAAVNAEPFAEELGITYELLADRDGAYFSATASFGMPTTLFVRPDGTIAERHTGVLTFDEAAEIAERALGARID
jgi:cytochrome c biogenesis protein CcmG, thiol:disulfide interchange protein DsbE